MNSHPAAPAAAAQPRTESDRPAFLDPRQVRFTRQGPVLRLADSGREVTLRRAFPLTRPDEYVSVRDDNGREIGLLRDLAGLEPASRRLAAEELARRYLVTRLLRIVSARERFGVVDWEAETDRGRRRFTTRDLRDNVLRPAPGHYVFTDVDGNRYSVLNLGKLDSSSRACLLRQL